jgi:uncharacterized membrane protein YhaH (DUF805 family)
MDKDEAIHEVEEIKQVIADSRKRSDRRKYWIGAAIALAAVVISGLVIPIFAPIIAIGFIVGGIIARRQSSDPVIKAIAAGAIAIGITVIILTLLVIFGLMGWHTSTMTKITNVPISQVVTMSQDNEIKSINVQNQTLSIVGTDGTRYLSYLGTGVSIYQVTGLNINPPVQVTFGP